jgi:erythromycin esterase
MVATPLSAIESPPTEFLDWLSENAIPLDCLEAGNSLPDLEAFRDLIGSARILALGEATHGSREIFQLKRKVFEFCVTQMGFTVFGLEAGYADCLSINDYVLGNDDIDPELALSTIWCWDVEELLDLVRWIRDYNDRPETSCKVTFWGCDPVNPPEAVRRITDYLQQIKPLLARDALEKLSPLATNFNLSVYSALPAEWQDETARFIANLDRHLADAPATVRLLVRMLACGETIQRSKMPFSPMVMSTRAAFWAEAVGLCLELGGAESRIALWGHGLHFQRILGLSGLESIASRLTATFGEDFVTLGTAFYEGQFRSLDIDTREARAFTVPPAEAGTLDAAFAAVEQQAYVIDVRSLPRSGPIHQWLASAPPRRFAASVWSERWKTPDMLRVTVDLRDCFDILVFVRSTQAARGLRGSRDYNPRPFFDLVPSDLHPAVERLTFHQEADGRLSNWSSALGFEGVAYRINVSNGALEIAGDALPKQWWGDGIVCRTFDATAYAGRRVRFSATVQIAKPAPRNVILFIRVNTGPSQPDHDPSYAPSSPLAYFAGLNQAVLNVDKAAATITIGIVLSGHGQAIFCDPSFEVIED